MEDSTTHSRSELVDLIGPLKEYLTRVCPALLSSVDSRKLFEASFNLTETVDVLSRFSLSSDFSLLLVELFSNEVKFSLEIKTSTSKVISSIALVKTHDLPLESNRPVATQLQVISLIVNPVQEHEDSNQSFFAHLHQITRHLHAPLARCARQNAQQMSSSEMSDEDDHVSVLQKRLRELDFALEQCQRGTAIPNIVLPTPVLLANASKSSNASILRNYLDKYNPSQVDSLLTELSLTTAMGETEEDKEEFANEVNKTAKLWPGEIIKQTRLVDSPFAGSVEKEINFWKDLDKKMADTKEQLDSPAILLTKLILKRTNRVSEQLIHEAEIVLDRSLKTVNVSLSFLRDFPIEELQATLVLHPKLTKCIASCLNHFGKLKHSTYDFSRAVRLLEVLGSVILSRVVAILRDQNILQCSMEELRVIKGNCDEVFLSWKTNLSLQRTTLKDVAKRRNEKVFNLKFDFDALQTRIAAIVDFREQNEKLMNILSVVLSGNTEHTFLSDLSEGYQLVIRTTPDIFDISPAGQATWANALQLYERRLEKIEEHITRILEEKLSVAKTADEMFRIFSIFNPLFFRPAIRNAVNSFRTTLVINVREDVKKLQEKFRLRYDESHERVTADLRDIPPLAGRIIWAKQIENQLTLSMKRIQDVLGIGWEDHVEGKQLKEVCDELRNYLDTSQIYEDWLTVQLKADTMKYSKLKDFLLLVEEDPRNASKFLKVNFDEKQVVVFKEVSYLEWLLPNMPGGFKSIPITIKTRATEAYARYPVTLALQSILTTYTQAKKKVTPSNSLLLTSHVLAVRDIVKEAIGGSKRSKWIKWDSKELSDWVSHLSNKVYSLQERVDDVIEKCAEVESLLHQLTTCAYDRPVFEMIMSDLQAIVNELPLKGLSNVGAWVSRLDKRLEGVMSSRLSSAITTWVTAFNIDNVEAREMALAKANNRKSGSFVNKDASPKVSQPPTPTKPTGERRSFHTFIEDKTVSKPIERGSGELVLDCSIHEIVLSNQVMFVTPPMEKARMHWIGEYQEHVAVVSTLPRISASAYQVFAESSSAPQDYSSVLDQLHVDVLTLPYIAIEAKLRQAREYIKQWLQYQALWDASVTVVADRLGRNIALWQQLLGEIKTVRMSVDSADEEKLFGPIVINHRQVQSKINLKYDTWQKDCQVRFGGILLEEIKVTHTELVNCKSRLETVILEGPTKDVIVSVEFILKVKASLSAMSTKVADLKSAEKVLQTQRFQFPPEWLSVSNVVSIFADLCDILDRRVAAMDTQLPALQMKIKEEDTAVSARTEKFLESWNTQKPVEGNLVSSDVLQTLSMVSAQLVKLAEDAARVRGAKEALNMDFMSDDRLTFVESEISDLREVWQAVAPVQEKLSALCSTVMKDLVPTKIRKQLEDLVSDLRSVPAKVRSYAAVETMQDKLAKYLSFQVVLRELCTDALKERHWKSLLTRMNISSNFMSLTVGDIWSSNALSHRKAIQEVLSTAQGELALEQYLRDLRDHWVGSEMQQVLRDGVKIVVGWETLFSTLEDNLNSLASLKQSPYFRNVPEFQEDTVNWESRLTHLRGMFDVWVEVQRKWMYLRGIFKNADIKAQLPAQYSKFKSIDNEYLGLMKRVATKPTVMDLLQVDNLLRQLERQDSTMAVIQKALGDYLERQRQIFPRFYFLNNDDLVEIIGNSNEPAKIVSHLGKMFSAISGLQMTNVGNESDAKVVASTMCSKEGETVLLTNAVDISVPVNDWLLNLESQMSITLATLLQDAQKMTPTENSQLLQWIERFPAQVIILASQLRWSDSCENSLLGNTASTELQSIALQLLETKLRALSESVLHDMDSALRKKCEQLLTEMVHQRDVFRLLISGNVNSKTDFGWLYHLRFYWNPKENDLMQRLSIKMSNASFFYGFEYLGIGERLVQTPLTDRCYLTLTQALHFRMGANPFGPAGTGKTESVKMLGSQLGRFVLVFNCDSSFDYAAMGRIFAGLCQVGAWGCFDEFNRLEERILSAVSQQILTIQRGLLMHQTQIELLGNPCKLSKDVGIFVTLNPGYAGRSNLPDNLKQLFRAVAMSVPDRKIISQVMLFSQGIVSAEDLAGKIVLLFTLCDEQLSQQSHYDFGLRALKSVLVGAGELKRHAVLAQSSAEVKQDMETVEKAVLIKATCDSVLPKLVSEDIHLFVSLLQAVFPGTELPVSDDKALVEAIQTICVEDSLEYGQKWSEKVLQLKQILDIRHGVMMVGPSGTGKTTAWRTLLKALGRVDGVKGDFYVIDPKSIKKEKLYGSLDPNTLEWTDGVFTKILRKVSDNTSVRGVRRSWIVFDGDVDPEWAENLNSVLDDNKILTLPSGDRLKIPNNVRIMMEVDTLRHATLATVSRCGMVWFASDTVSVDIILRQQLASLRRQDVQNLETVSFTNNRTAFQSEMQNKFVDAISPMFTASPSLVGIALDFAMTQNHIMEPTVCRLLSTLQSMLSRGMAIVFEHCEANVDLPMTDTHLEQFATKWLLFSILWSFGGSLTTDKRLVFCELITDHCNVEMPSGKAKLFDLQADVSTGQWVEWVTMVPRTEIESHKVSSTDVVITTTDTVRHVEVLKSWLASHKPLILCGPPGSGKTMTLTSVLENMPEFVLASLNFSSGSNPELILKTFAQYCEVVDSPDGLLMQPNRQSYRDSQWLVVFCDEINLPAQDAYGTQRVIMFLRQLTEQGGFWNADSKWVSLRRIQFVGACNPPTDAGRVVMSNRFLRHAPILLVDYPAEESLKQIYRSFNRALLKLQPNLKGLTDPLNNAMVYFYLRNQERFTPDMAPQYIYSPRELSRWVRALYEAIEPLDVLTPDELVRLWGHEAMRLFQDRLILPQDKEWCEALIDEVAAKFFPGVDIAECLKRPILYSNWIKKTYQSTDKNVLRDFVGARLKVFYEEELDVPLVIFDDVLEHVLRIDNVLRHPMGHLLLVGESGTGKTVLSRFVSWMNGLTVFQIKANNRYTIDQFDDDLRSLFRRVGIDGEKICFIFDESNALSSAFLERMNALLASGEVPGLFEGDERVQLMSACRDSFSQREGLMLDSEDELSRRFTRIIQRNLHVVFTMNPASSDFKDRCTTSPALFNRCVVDWFGTWSHDALTQVGSDFTKQIDTGYTLFTAPQHRPETLTLVMEVLNSSSITLSEAIVAALVNIHECVKQITVKLGKTSGRPHYISPRDYLDLIRNFIQTEQEKRDSLEDQQTHIRTGLHKLLETQDQVAELSKEMISKKAVLEQKDAEANLKLNLMVEKQNEAERRKAEAETLTIELRTQNEKINERRTQVEDELADAEPSLQSAKHSVQNIRKAQLDELRALARPPKAVQLTMEMVCIMIGEGTTDWSDIRKVIRGEEFIATVVNFDPLRLTPKQIKQVQDTYLSNKELDYTSVDRASKACGPLYNWAESQIKYATILKKIKPLRDEMASLQELSDKLEVDQKAAVANVEELETAIKTFKSEYALAIRDTEVIRSEMELVKKRVTRAQALLGSLDHERVRWQATSLSFDQQMSTLIGDSLIVGAFLTYAGIFDHKIRRHLLMEWSDILESVSIPFRAELDIIAHLSKPADQVLWRGHGLPNDELAIQNAILLDRFNRYPLVVDPSGQATKFILNKYAAQKIVQTSFLDASFFKTLASAIRFGTPLLVQDVENVDPILNPVLNKELQKTGGRTLIRLGNEDIDFSPKFLIILVTRNPLARFAPDLCSRVTLINFTVTPASLESQTLSALLKTERPDVDRRRSEVLKLQGEQSAKLRELQDALLAKISSVQGAILDDDSVINTLEIIKAESSQLNEEVNKTRETLEEVKEVSNFYLPLATAMASVYFSLESLANISFLYQYSLQFFLEIVDKVLSSTPAGDKTANNVSDPKVAKMRLSSLRSSFFNEISRRVLAGLRFEDKIMFLVRLAQIATHGQSNLELTDAELNHLLQGGLVMENSSTQLQKIKDSLNNGNVADDVARQLLSLSLLPAFVNLLPSLTSDNAAWQKVLTDKEPELHMPLNWLKNNTVDISPERKALLIVLLVKALRPERVLNALELYIAAVFGEAFEWREHSKVNLRQLVETDSKSSSPLMLCSEAGQDASSKVDALSTAMNQKLLQVSMGSAEGYTEADKNISLAAKTGCWVLLRNVHLCSEWLPVLEKRLHGMTTHNNFRLFMTCEINPRLPSALLRVCEVIVFEASTGMKANIQRFYNSIPSTRIDRQPAERARLYGLLAWFNAVVQERLRYTPLGWSKHYEFTEADTACSLDVIDEWVDELSGQRAHINPTDLPWKALQVLLSQSLYGGRVDDKFDQASLDSFIESIFTARNYSANAVLAHDQDGAALVTLPDSLSRQSFETWLKALPDTNSTSWIGLPVTAESQLRMVMASRVLAHVNVLQQDVQEDTTGGVEQLQTESGGGKDVQRLNIMLNTVTNWLATIPASNVMPTVGINLTSDATALPLDRCLAREIVKGCAVVDLVRSDLMSISAYCNGNAKLTNNLRNLMSCITSGTLPAHWRGEYMVSKRVNVGAWIMDLTARATSLQKYSAVLGKTQNSNSKPSSYWIGGMFSAESFVTATRQQTAQANKWSLEDLELYLEIGAENNSSSSLAPLSQDTVIEGLTLEGARHSGGAIHLTDELKTKLPSCTFKWRLKTVRSTLANLKYMEFPLYLNASRTVLLSEVLLVVSSNVPTHVWAQRGVAIVMSNL